MTDLCKKAIALPISRSSRLAIISLSVFSLAVGLALGGSLLSRWTEEGAVAELFQSIAMMLLGMILTLGTLGAIGTYFLRTSKSLILEEPNRLGTQAEKFLNSIINKNTDDFSQSIQSLANDAWIWYGKINVL